MSTCISKRGEFGSHEFVRSGDTVICEDCGYLTQAAPEPRSTPGPSTGTPEPSQAASEATPPTDWRARWEVAQAGLGVLARSLAEKDRAFQDAAGDAEMAAGEVARLREALEQVRALVKVEAGEQWTREGVRMLVVPADRFMAVLASLDTPAPDEACCDFPHEADRPHLWERAWDEPR